jgi:hypothetical protein
VLTQASYQSGNYIGHRLSKIEFSCLDDFIEEVRQEGVSKVHLDLVQNVRQSELSFVYYVSLEIVVTAQSDSGAQLYEYVERLAVVATTEPMCTDCDELARAECRLAELKVALSAAGFDVHHGRIVAAIEVS